MGSSWCFLPAGRFDSGGQTTSVVLCPTAPNSPSHPIPPPLIHPFRDTHWHSQMLPFCIAPLSSAALCMTPPTPQSPTHGRRKRPAQKWLLSLCPKQLLTSTDLKPTMTFSFHCRKVWNRKENEDVCAFRLATWHCWSSTAMWKAKFSYCSLHNL